MRFLFLFTLITILSPIHLLAQDKIYLSGIVRDNTDKPIAQSLVSLQEINIGVYTSDKGYYRIEVLPGNYTITASSLGFNTFRKTLNIVQNQKLDIRLEQQTVGLSTVEIIGKSKNQQLKESSLTVNSIDVKSQQSSLNNLNSLIGRSSGIRVREEGGIGSDFDLSINGLSGNSIRYFIDGVPLSTMGKSTSLANIPVNIVDRIDVYKGVVPVQLGTDALGGAVNIITQKSTKNYLDASYGMGSFGTYKADLNAQYVDTKTGIFVRPSIGINYSKNNYMMKDVEVWDASTSEYKKENRKRFHNDYLSLLSQINIGIRDKKWADILSLSGSFSSVDKELQTGAIQSIVYGKAKRKNKSYAISAQYVKNNFFTKDLSTDLYISHTWDNTTVIDTAYRKYRWDGSYTESSRNEITGTAKSIRQTKRPLTLARANFNYSINDHHSLNFNYLLEHINNKRYDDIDTSFTPTNDVFTKQTLGLAYNQIFLEGRLTNTFFVKDYISHLKIGQEDLYWITGSKEMRKSSTSNHWGYGFASRFIFAQWLAIKASFEHTVRLPIANEMLGNGTIIYPNLALKPENSNNINIGLFGSIEIASKHNLNYEVGAFYRHIKDYIRLDVSESDGLSQYKNVSNVDVKGIESEIRYTYDNLIQLIGNISYIDEKSKTKYQTNGKPDVTYNNRVPNKPWLYSNVELNIRKRDLFGIDDNQLKLAYYFQYVHWFYLTWEGYGMLNSKSTIPSQYLNSASLTYSLKNEKYNISLECNNIFDRLVYDNYMLQKPGRSIFCKLRVFIN